MRRVCACVRCTKFVVVYRHIASGFEAGRPAYVCLKRRYCTYELYDLSSTTSKEKWIKESHTLSLWCSYYVYWETTFWLWIFTHNFTKFETTVYYVLSSSWVSKRRSRLTGSKGALPKLNHCDSTALSVISKAGNQDSVFMYGNESCMFSQFQSNPCFDARVHHKEER